MSNPLASLLALFAFVVPAAAADAPITTAALLDDMTNLAALAEFPGPAYTCRQFSSYDRKSKSPDEEWFANRDVDQFLRVEEHAERKEHVMMDAAGPGAVVRIWSANPTGTIRFYLDGAEEAALTAPMGELLGGKYPGLPRPLAGEYSRGWNLYFPILYARHCKITSDAPGFYYHVNYRTYAEGTPVQTFSVAELKTLAERIARVAARLDRPRGKRSDYGGQTEPVRLEIPAGQSVKREYAGPKAFTRVALRLASADRDAALRGLVLKVAFDGEPCIEAPLGDAFGSGPGINPFATLPLGMTASGEMYSHWFMPFKDSAVVEIVNHSDQDATITGEVALADYQWTDRSMHYHAKWRVQFDLPTRPMIDWSYLNATGQGVFVGVAMTLDNPVKIWWGEGDEKIYVDGETFPSHFGTGTEDYYGYAWGSPDLFSHAYHAQPRCDGPANYGRTSLNRLHILDRIPFTKDFRFDMELWHWDPNIKVNMAVTSYWYARPGATDGFQPIRAEDLVIRPMPAYVPPKVAGAIEGETLKIVKVTGKVGPQENGGLSDERHLWWHAGMGPGDTLTVAFTAPAAGKYRVFGRFLRARDYGIHQLAVNGQAAGQPIDFYNPDIKPSEEIDLGVFELRAGENANEFSATITGKNAEAVPTYMFGLDYLRLVPVSAQETAQ